MSMNKTPLCVVYENPDGSYDVTKSQDVTFEQLKTVLEEAESQERPDGHSRAPFIVSPNEG